MKTKITVCLLLTAGASVFWGCWKSNHIMPPNTRLPANVLQSCTLSQTAFSSWFQGGTLTENGLVLPANSIAFPHNDNCDFYKWSSQMFLWITSPVTSGTYTNGNTVMESPVFYTATPEDQAGNRTLIPHTPGTLLNATSNILQFGPNELPVIVDKNGVKFEVESDEPGKKEMVKDQSGKLIQVGNIESGRNGMLSFTDTKGKEIKNAKPVIEHKINRNRIVRRFIVNGKEIFVDGNGNQVVAETGQAGSHAALVAKNGSLVYYISMVNDVYAYFLSGVRNKALDSTTFPVDSASGARISAYARSQNWPAPIDSNALAIELKTSWVETTNLSDSDSYITIDAMIPTYNQSNTGYWTVNGKKQARLALIGMHVVGSVAGHPEMIWATFEHQNNAPNAAYSYLDSNSNTVNVPADTGSNWLLNNNASNPSVNVQNMRVGGKDSILSVDSLPMGPANVLMVCAWGVSNDTVPNGENASPAASNSEIISINNSIQRMLVGNDIRKNYLLIGATWTFGGAAPNGTSYAPGNTANGVAIGTSQLANSTMETFVQSPTNTPVYQSYGSCLSCHSGQVNNTYSLSPDVLSHIFDDLLPLKPGTASKK